MATTLNSSSCYFYATHPCNLSGDFGFPVTGLVDYSAFYGGTDKDNRSNVTLGTNNEDHQGDPDELNLGDVLTMTLPDDITPDSGSPLVGTGDPALGLADDIFDTSREQPDTIGAVYVSSTPPTPPVPPGPPIPPRGRPAPIYNRPMRGRGGGSDRVIDWPV